MKNNYLIIEELNSYKVTQYTIYKLKSFLGIKYLKYINHAYSEKGAVSIVCGSNNYSRLITKHDLRYL